ncbi:hypothetical protein L2E82_36611, partial [Cichorium intybus]
EHSQTRIFPSKQKTHRHVSFDSTVLFPPACSNPGLLRRRLLRLHRRLLRLHRPLLLHLRLRLHRRRLGLQSRFHSSRLKV